MYWADCGVEPKIEQSRLDGSERAVLANTSVKAPFGLSLDRQNNTLYWCDQRLHTVSAIELSTLHTRTIATNISDCVGTAILGQHIYWADGSVLTGRTILSSSYQNLDSNRLPSNCISR